MQRLVVIPIGVLLMAQYGTERERAHTDPSGTWYVLVEIDEQRAIPEIATFHKDGRYNFTVPNGSSGYGEWVKTSNGEVEVIALQLNVDERTGMLASIEEGRGVLQFNDSFNLFTGKIFAVEYKCDGPYNCPYPLTDKPFRKMTPDGGLAIKGMRIGVVLDDKRTE